MNYEKLDSIVLSLKDELLADMKRWIAVPSVLSESAGPNAPFGKANREMLDLALETARKYGFEARDVDGYAGDVSMGSGEKTLGILCHLDVVPAGDSWTKDPWGAEIEDGKIYGRGTMDDKGPAFAALFGLAAVKASGVETKRRVRLILGCDEECGMGCLHHYNEVEKAPDMCFSPDASYPLVNSEKMIYNSAYRKEYASSVRVKAGTVSNAVPGKAEVFVPVSADEVKAAVAKLNNADFTYNVSAADNGANVVITGIAAHASTPEQGKNAFLAAVQLMNELNLPEEDADTVAVLWDILKFDCHGESIGIDSTDDSGRLTTNVGVIEWDETGIKRLTMDIRAPITANGELITEKLRDAFGRANMIETHHGWSDGYYVSPESELVSKLIGVYNARFNADAKPMAIGGGTYARHLTNAVAFGTEREDEPACIHMADENIRIDHLIEDAKIMADAILALAAK